MRLTDRLSKLEARQAAQQQGEGKPIDYSLLSPDVIEDIARHTNEAGRCDYSKMGKKTLNELMDAIHISEGRPLVTGWKYSEVMDRHLARQADGGYIDRQIRNATTCPD